jgi:hypothetical protein
VAKQETKMATEHSKAYLVLHASRMAVVVVVNVEPMFHKNCELVSQLKRRTIDQ